MQIDAITKNNLRKAPLEKLFIIAELYGSLDIFSVDNEPTSSRYKAKITFSTTKNIQLEAKSNFRLPINIAIADAIIQACEIVESVQTNAPTCENINNLLIGISKQK